MSYSRDIRRLTHEACPRLIALACMFQYMELRQKWKCRRPNASESPVLLKGHSALGESQIKSASVFERCWEMVQTWMPAEV